VANQLASNPLTLDTPGKIFTAHMKINNIEFVGYSVDTDAIVIQDILGNNLWDARGSVSFNVVRSGHIGWVNGLVFVSITPASTGLVKVYFE
jgi:hypothetical protein